MGIGSGLTPGATYTLEVLVKNFGYAMHENTYSIKFLSAIDTVIPNVSSNLIRQNDYYWLPNKLKNFNHF